MPSLAVNTLLYTVLRFGLFLSTIVIVAGVWHLVAGVDSPAEFFWAALIAAVLSALMSPFLFQRQRDALALQIQEKASRASERLERQRAAEDD